VNQRHLFFLIFTLSGFSGLIYESIWSHYLKLFLGHAAYSQTLVLAIFMGGMSFGAWLTSRMGGRIKNMILTYALVEATVGIIALFFHPLFVMLTNWGYDSVIPAIGTGETVKLFQWALAAAMILPQSILLGSTFPLMSSGIIRRFPDHPGKTLAFLYFTNSLGAAIGVLVSGFVLIEWVGLPGAVTVAGILNLVVALIVAPLAMGKIGSVAPETGPALPSDAPPVAEKKIDALTISFFICAFGTGFASFLYEIGWIRMLTQVLGAATHSFELMLSAFILGLAIGGYLIRKRIDSLTDELKTLGLVQLIMAAMALGTVLIYEDLFYVMGDLVGVLQKTDQGYLLFNVASHAICLVVMLPATIFAGMTLPLLTHYLFIKGHGEAAIGKIYAANTIGAILGVMVAVQVVMPWFGLKAVVVTGAAVDVAIGVYFLWRSSSRKSSPLFWPMTAGATAMVLVIGLGGPFDSKVMATGVYLFGSRSFDVDRKILFHKDGKTATVNLSSVSGGADNDVMTLRSNGKPDASIGSKFPTPDEPTQTLLGVIPLSLKSDAKKIAVVGLGSGMTSHTLLHAPWLETVDTIEIEQGIVDAARVIGAKVENIFNDSRSHIVIEDAKTYLTSTQGKYDLIISEPSNPWVSGVSGLFSVEYYARVKRHLAPGGVYAQWFHLYSIDKTLLASVILAVGHHFEDYAIYNTARDDILIIAVPKGKTPLPTGRIFESVAMRAQLGIVGVNSVADISIRLLGTRATLHPFFKTFSLEANSDFFPILDLGATRSRFMQLSASDIGDLQMMAMPVVEAAEGVAPPDAGRKLGNNNVFPRAEVIHIAQRTARILTGERLPGDVDDTISKSTTLKSGLAIANIGSCDQEYAGTIFTANVHEVAGGVIPFLHPSELEPLFNAIEQRPCFKSAGPDLAKWLALYHSLGARDYKQSAALANAMLPDAPEVIRPSPLNDRLLTASMLSHLAVGQPQAVLDLFLRYPLPIAQLPLELRYLVAVASYRVALQKREYY
jgi:predicted membrane-bound spermidine synthase